MGQDVQVKGADKPADVGNDGVVSVGDAAKAVAAQVAQKTGKEVPAPPAQSAIVRPSVRSAGGFAM